jgi:hypothetical protein
MAISFLTRDKYRHFGIIKMLFFKCLKKYKNMTEIFEKSLLSVPNSHFQAVDLERIYGLFR